MEFKFQFKLKTEIEVAAREVLLRTAATRGANNSSWQQELNWSEAATETELEPSEREKDGGKFCCRSGKFCCWQREIQAATAAAAAAAAELG